MWSGSPTSSLDVRCHYTKEYTNRGKHFCKVMEDGLCNMLVSSQDNITQSTQNRYTLTDNQQDGFFTVHLNNLIGEDTGVYLCGGQNPSPPFNKVLLVGGEARIIVNPVIGCVGGKAKLRCPYEVGYQNDLKYLSRGGCFSGRGDVPIKMQKRHHTQVTQGRFSLQDERMARVFTVIISNLTAEDSGKYCCGIKTLDNKVLLEVILTVTKASTSPSFTPVKDKAPFASTPPMPSAVTTKHASCTADTALVLSVLRVVAMLLFAVAVTLFFKYRKNHTLGTS